MSRKWEVFNSDALWPKVNFYISRYSCRVSNYTVTNESVWKWQLQVFRGDCNIMSEQVQVKQLYHHVSVVSDKIEQILYQCSTAVQPLVQRTARYTWVLSWCQTGERAVDMAHLDSNDHKIVLDFVLPTIDWPVNTVTDTNISLTTINIPVYVGKFTKTVKHLWQSRCQVLDTSLGTVCVQCCVKHHSG